MESKQYLSPQFELIRRDETDKVFFQTSGTSGSDPKSVSATSTLKGITSW